MTCHIGRAGTSAPSSAREPSFACVVHRKRFCYFVTDIDKMRQNTHFWIM